MLKKVDGRSKPWLIRTTVQKRHGERCKKRVTTEELKKQTKSQIDGQGADNVSTSGEESRIKGPLDP